MFRKEMATIAISRTKITKQQQQQEELADIKDKLKKSYYEYQTAI